MSNVEKGTEELLPKKKVDETKYGRTQAAGKLLELLCFGWWQGRFEGCVLGVVSGSRLYALLMHSALKPGLHGRKWC